jgi:predicted DsbA family dithiol-disulfide isomerase
MKILMATDVVSPFCWMAPMYLEQAMAKFPDVEFELELWPFQVTPGLPQDYTFEQYLVICNRSKRCWDKSR